MSREPLAFVVDASGRTLVARAGQESCTFTFNVTNISDRELVIERVRTTCGCSIAKMPAEPWKLAPWAAGAFEIVVDLRGKSGRLTKGAFIETVTESKTVAFSVVMLAAADESEMQSRDRNVEIAKADRQAIFKGDCMRCHVTPALELSGEPLYAAACGICHEADHRAAMVPDLGKLPFATNREFWKQIATHGKPGTLMPAFGKAESGPLSREQIDSIADYLAKTYSLNHPASSK